jgi:hypothetical protein
LRIDEDSFAIEAFILRLTGPLWHTLSQPHHDINQCGRSPSLLSVDMLRVADRVDDSPAGNPSSWRVAGCVDAELWVDAGRHGCYASRPTRTGHSLVSVRLILIPI